jgi:molybdate transport system ATP-binding protein
LDRFDLDVDYEAEHRVTGLFGVSGSGKTTWLEALAGLRRNATGRICCGGELWLDTERGIRVPPEGRNIGYVPQEHLLFPHKSVRGNLLFARRRALRRGVVFERAYANVAEVLELEPLLERSVAELSGGERQRVALGRALCSGPSLLLLDEPLASLDAQLRHRILPFLKRVRDAFEIPILIVSHNPTELLALCDEIVAVREGRIVASGRPMDVLTRPEVFSLAESQGFLNILPCRMAGHTLHSSTVRLGADGDGPQITIPRVNAPEGESMLVGVAASEILVSRAKPEGLSARNRLPVRISSVREAGHIVLLAAQLHESLPPIAVEITADAMEELDIGAGEQAYLIIKSSSFTTYSEHEAAGQDPD